MRKSTFVKTSTEILKSVNTLFELGERIADEDRSTKVKAFATQLDGEIRGLLERSEAVFGKSGRKEMPVSLSLKTMRFLVTKHDVTVRALNRAFQILQAEEERVMLKPGQTLSEAIAEQEPDQTSPVDGRPQYILKSGAVLTLKK